MNPIKVFGALFTLALIACSPSKDHTFDESQVKAEVKEMMDRYFHAIEEEGLSGEFAFLDSSEAFFWVPPGFETPLTFDSVRNILLENDPNLEHLSYHIDSLIIQPISREVATYAAIISGNITDTGGNTTRVRLIESGTLIKREDGWKYLSGQSRNLPLRDNP